MYGFCVFFSPCSIKKIKITVSSLRELAVYSISCHVDQTKPVNLMTFRIYYLYVFKSILLSTEKANEHYGLA